MRTILKPILVVLVAVLLVKCSDNKYTITKGKVGEITTKTTVKDINTIFKNDSIVKILSEGAKGNNYFQDDDEYLIFEKGGKHLLTIVPKEQLDETSTLKSIQVFDSRYKTESGLNVNSTFNEINANVKVSKVETSILSATLFIDELNTTITIDKEDLGLKQIGMQKVSIEQIPDLAKIKSFIVWFN